MGKQGLSLYQCVERVKGTEEREKNRENQIESTKTQIVRKKKMLIFGSLNWFQREERGKRGRNGREKGNTNRRERRNPNLERENHPKYFSAIGQQSSLPPGATTTPLYLARTSLEVSYNPSSLLFLGFISAK